MGSNDHLEGSGMGPEPEAGTRMLDLIQSVSALKLESDELVVLYVPSLLSSEERTELRRSFSKACPNTRSMIVDGGVTVEPMSVEPNDKVVVRCPGVLSQQQREEWLTRLAAIFPENNCIVLEPGETVDVASEWIMCAVPKTDNVLVCKLEGKVASVAAECPNQLAAVAVMDAMRARDQQKGD